MFDDDYYMRLALDQARAAQTGGEVPVGAIVVSSSGEVIGEGNNRVLRSNDPSAHAEIVALRAAGLALGNYRLLGCTLFCTLEPCAMCAGAVAFARIRRLYYGAADLKGGAVDNGVKFFASPTCHHRPEVYGGLAEAESAALLKDFFEARR